MARLLLPNADVMRNPLPLGLVVVFLAACGTAPDRPHGTLPDADSDVDTDVDSDTDTGSDVPVPVLTVRRVEPNHGPVGGGNVVEVRGGGFGGAFTADGVTVTFGGRMVEAPDMEILGPGTIRVLKVPPGEVGPADVEVRTAFPGSEPESAILGGGYTYDAFSVDPPRGSIAGGTRVGLYGFATTWDERAAVTFAGREASGCVVLGATRIDCRTPPGEPGRADVRVADRSGTNAYDDVVSGGFEYYNSADPIGGGLGGGPIDGQVSVTVLHAYNLLPVVEAFVMLGTDGETEHQGLTNVLGQIAFESDDLEGPQVLTAAKEDFESTTFAFFDARDVTVFLVPYPTPSPGGGGVVRAPSSIAGEVVFEGPNEFGPNPWTIVPDPVDPDEHKECEVRTTQADPFSENPNPGFGFRVTEDEANPLGRGYSYSIASRPAALAVWAICGLKNDRTHVFLPYVMGVARNVIVGPGEHVDGVDVLMNIPLDHLAVGRMRDTPVEGEAGPEHYRMDAFLDLGGEGLIVRDDSSVRSGIPDVDFRFVAQSPLVGTIEDAQWLFIGGAYTGGADRSPFSVVIEKGIVDTRDPIVLDDFLGVPVLTDPGYGGTVVDGRLAWDAPGGMPTFNHVEIRKAGMPPIPIWHVFVRGDVTEVTLPDLVSIAGLPPPPRGTIGANVWAVRLPGLSFDQFSYVHLNPRYWQAYAADGFLIGF